MKKNIKYILYARRSSESEDRQIQSIDDQVERLKHLAKETGIIIIKIVTESKSAKKPNNRPVFEEVLKEIETGKADGILCWQFNRLSRNPIDTARLQWLLQQNILKSIQTYEKEYLPEDNALLLSVEGGIANQYIIDLRKNTKRGVDSKISKGWRPSAAPLGYLNDKDNKIITKDPERFNLVRKMWDLMLTGNYTPPKIMEIANKEWGFRTRKFKRFGGGELTRSGTYAVFTNLFYTGCFEWGGSVHQGKHEPMITFEEFDRVQVLLGRKGKPRPKKHKFAFTGAIRCSECGCVYTAETKKKIIKGTGEIREHTYYHCTRKRRDMDCTQRKNVTEKNLEEMIELEIEQLTIHPDFLKWVLEELNEKNDTEIEDRTKIYEMQHNDLTKAQSELDNLTKMRYRDLIDDETFLKEKKELTEKIRALQEKLRSTEDRAEKWLELTEKTFSFATYAHKEFLLGDMDKKKEILLGLGQNPIIKDGKIFIEAEKYFQPIKNNCFPLNKEYEKLEPHKYPLTKAQTEAIASVRTRLLRR